MAKNIYGKLNAVRDEFHKIKLTMSGHNSFSKYNYFELGDFIPVAVQLFEKHGLCPVVTFKSDEAMLTVHDTDSDEVIVITSPIATANVKGCSEIQNLGSVHTYLRRYLYNILLEICDHDVLDEIMDKNAPSDKAPIESKPFKPTKAKKAQVAQAPQAPVSPPQEPTVWIEDHPCWISPVVFDRACKINLDLINVYKYKKYDNAEFLTDKDVLECIEIKEKKIAEREAREKAKQEKYDNIAYQEMVATSENPNN